MRRIAAVLLLALALPASADVIHLVNGSTMEGRIASEDADGLQLKLAGGGEIRVKRGDVQSVEMSDQAAARAAFDAKCKDADADALVAAAGWARFHGLDAECASALREALKKNPDHAGAHEALGHRQLEGKWVTGEEYMKATGHVKAGGKWLTAEEAEALKKKPEPAKAKPEPAAPAKAGPKAAPGFPPQDAADDALMLKCFGAGWHVKCGQRYRLTTNCQDDDKEFDAKFLKAMDEQWNVYCDTLGLVPAQKKLHNAVIFATRDSYNSWCQKNAPAGNQAYGVYLQEFPGSPTVLWHGEAGLRGALYTGRHEGGHQFVGHYVRRDGGTWFVEGLATYFEPDVTLPEYPYRWDSIHAAVFKGEGDMPLKNLVEAGTGVTAAQGYNISASVHWFFLTGKNGAYRKAYQKFLRDGKVDSSKALADALGQPIEALDKEWRAFIREMDGKKK